MPSDHSDSSHSSSSFDSGSSYSSGYNSGSDYDSGSSFFSSSDSDYTPSFDSSDSEAFEGPALFAHEVTHYEMPPERERSNQPSCADGSDMSYLIRSTKHDYIYLPKSGIDDATGKRYEKGYYDEKGSYYKRVIVKKGSDYKTRAECSFCGTQIKLKWKEGALPSCPNCGAALEEILHSSIIEEELQATPKTVLVPAGKDEVANGKVDVIKAPAFSKPGLVGVILLITACAAFLIAILVKSIAMAMGINYTAYNSSPISTHSYDGTYQAAVAETTTKATTVSKPSETTSETSETTYKRWMPGLKPESDYKFGNSIYVEAIGRTCNWDKSGNFYDPKTDCYFWFNTNVRPAIWQYWYEGISSDFGDYGWMEYDFYEKVWYIETSKGKWEVLPDKYDTSKLWHFEDNYSGKYKGKNKIYVNELRRHCEFYPTEGCYFDPYTGCHFYYDSFTGGGTWFYWFQDLHNDQGLGWLKYENGWQFYKDGKWFKTDLYYMSDCWHIMSEPR